MFSSVLLRHTAAASVFFVLAFCSFTFSQTLTVLHTSSRSESICFFPVAHSFQDRIGPDLLLCNP
jgi:hypothetical protein